MTDFPWDVATLLGLCMAGVIYIILAIIIYANSEE